MKKCITCGIEKEYSEYYQHPKMADGYLGRCKVCHRAGMKRNREENIDYYREYDAYRYKNDHRVKIRHKAYQSSPMGAAASRRAHMKFVKNNPEKRAAHVLLGNAVRDGRIFKPETCSVCGEFKPRRQIHGHHEDYCKPLDVVWMCSHCHYLHHNPVDNA